MVQNAVDAVEDAILLDLPRPYEIHVHVDMHTNRLSVRDSGIGMSREEAIRAFAPSVSFKILNFRI
jgi:HSP90 family molecular chaperone